LPDKELGNFLPDKLKAMVYNPVRDITMPDSVSKAPNCLKCAYFKVTWDPSFPRACGIFGIKSLNLPSFEVFRATGRHCPSFLLKEGLK
jgi:hypothetical protein